MLFFFAVFICNMVNAKESHSPRFSVNQIDSLIQEKSINSAMTKLELLVLYQNAYENKHSDSVSVFKNLAILNAELKQPKDAHFFTEKCQKTSYGFCTTDLRFSRHFGIYHTYSFSRTAVDSSGRK